MSIRDEVNRCVEAGTLFVLQPALSASRTERTILISAEFIPLLHGPWKSLKDEVRWNRVRADLDWFIGGDLIVVSDDGYMKPLDPESDGAWEVSCRNPKPSIRIFGAFTETEVFAALTWRYRISLGARGSTEWAEAIRQCKAHWRNLFFTYPPQVGSQANEYISEHAVRI
jgi:hypothetical protein